MDVDNIAALAAATAATAAALSIVQLITIALTNRKVDGRSNRKPAERLYSIRTNQFKIADGNSIYNDGWFHQKLRCTKTSFNSIVDTITNAWLQVHDNYPAHNAVFSVRERVGVMLHYLTHSDAIHNSSTLFGMSKTTAWQSIEEVLEVLVTTIEPTVIYLPTSTVEWHKCASEFEAVNGFPDACLAVDGTLIEILRPKQYKGWYCRKGFPAINMQIAVDARHRIRSFCMRPGSENDSGVYSRSEFGKKIHRMLPQDYCIIADAGYKLYSHCLMPYDITLHMSCDEKHYNYMHSTMRMNI